MLDHYTTPGESIEIRDDQTIYSLLTDRLARTGPVLRRPNGAPQPRPETACSPRDGGTRSLPLLPRPAPLLDYAAPQAACRAGPHRPTTRTAP